MIRIVGLLVILWLVVGAVAAGQRGYFTHASQTCAGAGTIAATVIAGPLNYFGVSPKVTKLQCASTQLMTRTASSIPMNPSTMLNPTKEPT